MEVEFPNEPVLSLSYAIFPKLLSSINSTYVT